MRSMTDERFNNGFAQRILTSIKRAGDKGDSGGGAKAAAVASAGMKEAGQGIKDVADKAYDDAMDAARDGVDKDAPKPDRFNVLATDIPSYKRGGTMKYRGIAKLHKGERAKSRSSRRGGR